MKIKRFIGIFLLTAAVLIAFFIFHKSGEENSAQNAFIIERVEVPIETEEISSEQFDFGPDAPEEFKYITEGIVGLGDSFVIPMLNLKVTINSVALSSNVYDAGWAINDLYLNEAMVILNNALSLDQVNMLRDNIDYSTGTLAEGLTLITVDVTVKNLNTNDTSYGPEPNVFGNDILYLVNARTTDQNSYGALPAYKSVACSCEKPISGQSAWVRILPGESQQYKLAYIADDFVAVENGFISSYNVPMEGVCFLPLILAEGGYQ